MWKCRPLGWLWGLPLLALLWLPVYFGERSNIETDLGDRVTTKLDDAGLGWAKARFDGRDGVLSGTARNVRDHENAMAIARQTWGVRIIDEKMDLLRRVSPYTWSANREGSRLMLEGFVPNPQDREAVVTMAESQFPNDRIVDNMVIASGEPDRRTYLDSVGFGLKQLSGFTFGKVELSDRRLSIEGMTRDEQSFNDVEAALKSDLPADVRIARRAIRKPEKIIPLASPLLWVARKEGRDVRLSGHVHSEEVRSDIVAAARRALPDARITDNMELAHGRPSDAQWRDGTRFGLSQLARLEDGVVSLSDHDYSIRGRVDTVEANKEIDKGLQGLPEGFKLAGKNIDVPKIDPYHWRADYHSQRLTLSGYVPDEVTRRSVKAQAKQYFPEAYLVDNMDQGPGAPDNWQRATNVSLEQLARLQNGNAMIWNREIEIRGEATSAEMRDGVLARMRNDAPSNFEFFNEIRVPEPVAPPPEVLVEPRRVTAVEEQLLDAEERLERDTCQTYLDSILSENSIQFDVASAKLKPESFATITRLAHVAKRCPETYIEIAGHTDSDGSSKFNKYLSRRRARSVVKFLSQSGVSGQRLSAVGYGEARPIVPNSSKENKARNRRIEFLVKTF